MSSAGREWLIFKMERDYYEQLDEQQREGLLIDRIEIEGEDFSSDERWKSLKKESVKSYKKLKEHEHFLKTNK